MGARHSVSVVGVVVNDRNEVLVAERQDGTRWEPPGGVLELDEPILDGLKREVLEETGYVIEPERLVSIQKNMAMGVVALIFRAHVTGGELRTSFETPSVEWWTAEQVIERMPKPFAARILDALEEQPTTVRNHDGQQFLL